MESPPRIGLWWHLKVGDRVTRMLAGVVPMELVVVTVDETTIMCGLPEGGWSHEPGKGWMFDRATGAEIDEELRWGPRFGITGSYLVKNRLDA